jgi:hypothetical protein
MDSVLYYFPQEVKSEIDESSGSSFDISHVKVSLFFYLSCFTCLNEDIYVWQTTITVIREYVYIINTTPNLYSLI